MNRVYSSNNLEKQAGEKLSDILESSKDFPILLLISGGSSLKLLDYVRIHQRESFYNNSLTVGVLDERFTTREEDTNFYRFTKTTLFHTLKELKTDSVFFLDPRVWFRDTLSEISLQEAGQRYEEMLRGWQSKHKDGKIIITQGIGVDGHTGGILPMTQEPEAFSQLFESDKWVVGYDASYCQKSHSNPHPRRITTTLTFLRNRIDQSVVFIKGEDKQAAVSEINTNTKALNELPGAIIHDMKEVFIYTSHP